MNFKNLLDDDIIHLGVKASCAEELLGFMSDSLEKHDYVKSSFKEAIINREQEFATGLPLESGGIAIPHTTTEHVNQAVVSVAILDKPVPFKMMGNHDETVYADVIFMLALKQAHTQLEMLQDLMKLIQDQDMMKQMKEATCTKDIIQLLEVN